MPTSKMKSNYTVKENIADSGVIFNFGDNDSALKTAFYGDIVEGGLLASQITQDIYAQSLTQKYPLGTKLKKKKPDGREFIYCKAGTVNLAPALMCQAPVSIANYREQVQTAYGWAIGAKTGTILITTGATPAVDAWKDGWLIVNQGAGIGQAYRIKSNTSHATIPTVTLYDAIVTAFTATSEITIIANQFNGTIVVPVTTATARAIGVPLLTITAAYYYWSQIKGPCPATVDTGDTLVIGEPCGGTGATTTVAGAFSTAVTLKGHYGRVLYIGTADETALVDLDLGL